MPTITFHNGSEILQIEVSSGTRLMDVLLNYGLPHGGACGGRGICGKCRIRITGTDQTVSACHHRIESDLSVDLEKPSGTGILKGKKNGISLQSRPGIGMALDLGTTTLAYYLFDLQNGKLLAETSVLNPQSIFGADVISRIEKADAGFLEEENRLIVSEINRQIREWKKAFGFSSFSRLVVAGNTTMQHLLWGVSPSSIGKAPYRPIFLEGKRDHGSAKGLDAEEVVLLPGISAFIGADMTAGILSSGLMEEKTALLVDLGTNGEIILKDETRYFGCSAATGPAFEGANIEKGMGGIRGAISRVVLGKNDLEWNVLGGTEPMGICGSGLIDLIGILVSEGLIDESGAWNPDVSSCLRYRLEGTRFLLSHSLWISQKDIRQFQLGKAAIRAAIETLLAESRVDIHKIDRVFVAGGFGFYLDMESALKTGIFPKDFRGRIESVGNTSGSGASLVLLDEKNLAFAEDLASGVLTVDLMKVSGFNDRFVDFMGFEEGGAGS